MVPEVYVLEWNIHIFNTKVPSPRTDKNKC